MPEEAFRQPALEGGTGVLLTTIPMRSHHGDVTFLSNTRLDLVAVVRHVFPVALSYSLQWLIKIGLSASQEPSAFLKDGEGQVTWQSGVALPPGCLPPVSSLPLLVFLVLSPPEPQAGHWPLCAAELGLLGAGSVWDSGTWYKAENMPTPATLLKRCLVTPALGRSGLYSRPLGKAKKFSFLSEGLRSFLPPLVTHVVREQQTDVARAKSCQEPYQQSSWV
jgi:hypothetical protein